MGGGGDTFQPPCFSFNTSEARFLTCHSSGPAIPIIVSLWSLIGKICTITIVHDMKIFWFLFIYFLKSSCKIGMLFQWESKWSGFALHKAIKVLQDLKSFLYKVLQELNSFFFFITPKHFPRMWDFRSLVWFPGLHFRWYRPITHAESKSLDQQ